MLRVLVAIALITPNLFGKDTWNQWRGPSQNGVAAEGNFPVNWSDQENIAWKFTTEGKGGSTPIVVDEHVLITQGHSGKNQLTCYSIDGKKQWETSVGADSGGKHKKGSGSNPSPVSDGDSVYCYFRSGDVAKVNMKGQVLWHTNLQKRYGSDTLWWDLGTSPVLSNSAVIIAVMQSGPSYLVALDKKTGDELWKSDRMLQAPEEAAQSYSTPLVITRNGREMIAVLGADHVTLHDAKSGKELGRLGGFNPNAERYWRSIASPVADGDLIFCPYARGNTITAVSISKLAEGGGEDAVLWRRDGLGADVPSPIAIDGRLYVVSDRGRIECVNASDGTTLWTGALPKHRMGYSSSAVLASGRLYFTREDATTFVVETGDAFQLTATNQLSSGTPYTVASLVPVDSGFFIRTSTELVRVVAR